MKTIGLIGGMSWESTLVYYRMLNEGVRARRGALHSAAVLLHSLDFESVVRLQKAGRWDEAGAMLGAAGAGLARAGADCVLICTNTMHLVSDAVARAAGVPLIDIIAETGRDIAAAGRRRPLLLATRYTMEHGFYAERCGPGPASTCWCPGPDDRGLGARHHLRRTVPGACAGNVVPGMMDVIARGVAAGADSVILGCTEICLLLDPASLPVPGFDSTAIHAAAALDFALGAEPAPPPRRRRPSR